jgi:hypothetical protein
MYEIYFRTYIKYKDKFLIPKYQCDEIFEDIFNLMRLNNNGKYQFIDNCERIYTNNVNFNDFIKNLLRKKHSTKKRTLNVRQTQQNTNFY